MGLENYTIGGNRLNKSFGICLVCGEGIFDHTETLHGIACLKTLHEWLQGYANTQKMLQSLGNDFETLTKNVTHTKDRKRLKK